jgi:hypothetical protein
VEKSEDITTSLLTTETSGGAVRIDRRRDGWIDEAPGTGPG